MELASVAQSDARTTGAQQVPGLIPAGRSNILSLGYDHEIFSKIILSFHWFKKGSCQCLAKNWCTSTG